MLSNEIIIIPLHLPLKYPCDYIDQTAKILSKKHSVILFDYYHPYSWKNLLEFNNLKKFSDSFSDILNSKKIIYFRASAILPFSRTKIIINLNKKLGFVILSVFLRIFKKRVIVWQFYPLITRKIFKNQFYLYDCIDNINLNDQNKKFFYEEKNLFKISDLVSFNSRGLFESKLKVNPILAQKTVTTVCGCNNILFNVEIKKIPKEFANIPQKKVVFMGIFDFRMDIKLLYYVLQNNRDLKFIFIGPTGENTGKEFYEIIKEKNVLYLGERKKDELPSYLKNSNLGIIPYDTRHEFAKYSNPMKAYEYLASGLPVVSTKILALEDYPKDIIYTTDNKEAFSQTIRRLMSSWNDKKITIAKDIAEKNSWENKIGKIEEIVLDKFIRL